MFTPFNLFKAAASITLAVSNGEPYTEPRLINLWPVELFSNTQKWKWKKGLGPAPK
jgi:hypothetical protein